MRKFTLLILSAFFALVFQNGLNAQSEIYLEEFETDLGATSQQSVVGAEVWVYATYGTPAGCAKMSGYSGGAQDNEDWLITNSIDCSGYSDITLQFTHARNYEDNNGLSVLVSNDYDGISDPNTSGTWNDLTAQFTFPATGSWDFIDAGTVNIDAYAGATTYIAFKYTSTTAGAATWEVDSIYVAGVEPLNTFIAGSFNSWSGNDPAYQMAMNANGVAVLTKNLAAGTHMYKMVNDGNWYPADDQSFDLAAATDVTWRANTTDNFVTHTNPVLAGSFFEAMGLGSNWAPDNMNGEMTDADGDDIFEIQFASIPLGSWEYKITLNHNWNQSTSGNQGFYSDGVTPITFYYDMSNNGISTTAPGNPSALVTFIIDDSQNQTFTAFYLKGSWDADGNYDPAWNGGAEHSDFYDDGTHGDVTAGDHIWTTQQNLISDGGGNTWEWGFNDQDHEWVTGNFQFTVPDETAQNLEFSSFPAIPSLVITEIMYNPPEGGTDSLEFIEIYNNGSASANLENYFFGAGVEFNFPAGADLAAGGFMLVAVDSLVMLHSFGVTAYEWTSGGLSNGGEDISIKDAMRQTVAFVEFDDAAPWPTSPDGDGPSLTFCDPDLDNNEATNWSASTFFQFVNADNDSIWATPGTGCDPWTDPPIANFDASATTILTGSSIDFYDMSQGDPHTWSWTLQGSTQGTSTEQNPTGIQYNTPGVYDVCLVVTNDFGDDTKCVTGYITVEDPVDADIVITEIMYNPPESGDDSLEFIEIYNNGTNDVNLRDWYFAEGIEFVFPEVTINAGEFMLIAKNAAAMNSTFGVTAYEWTDGGLSNGGELLQLNDRFNVIADTVAFDDGGDWPTSPDGDGPSLTFCDPSLDNAIATNWSASVELAAINTEGDSIWATPGAGCSLLPLADFTSDITVVEIGGDVAFTDMSSGEPTEWLWEFEGGTPATSTEQNPTIVYETEGTYNVSLTVTNAGGSDTKLVEDYIIVSNTPPPPAADFEADMTDIMVGGSVQFTDLSLYDPTSWSWSFEGGEPATSTEENPTVVYNTPGVYNVELTATNDFGSDVMLKEAYITVRPEPSGAELVITEIMYNPPEEGDDSLEFIEIYNNSADAVNLEGFYFEAGIVFVFPSYDLSSGAYVLVAKSSAAMTNTFGVESLQWTEGGLKNSGELLLLKDAAGVSIDSVEFLDVAPWPVACDGDGPSLTLCNPNDDNALAESWAASTEFAAVNTVGDTIWATPGEGCVFVFPIADFKADTTVVRQGHELQFTDLSLGNPTSWEWTFEGGEPATSTEQNPIVTYNDLGVYSVTLTVTNENGSDTETKTDYIEVVLNTGIDELDANAFSMYPNPAKDQLFISTTLENAEIHIYNIVGETVYTENIHQSNNAINISALESGVYLVQMRDMNSGKIRTEKLIIK